MISHDFIRKCIQLHQNTIDIDEETLKLGIAFMDSWLQTHHMALVAIDDENNLVFANTLAASLFEQSEASMVGKPLKEVLPESPLLGITLANYRSVPTRFKMMGKKIQTERAPLYIADKLVAIICYFYEDNDNNNSNQRINQSLKNEMFLNEIIDNSSEGIYVTDSAGMTILVNKAYERISGIKRSLLIGEYMDNLVASGLVSTTITKDVVESKKTVTRTQTNANNKEVYITGTPVFDEMGNVRHVITIVRDITNVMDLTKKLKNELSRASLYQSHLMNISSEENIVYNSIEFKNILNICKKVSQMDSTVLILGETGVGKEVVAQYIHKNSNRKSKPYIKVNCGAIPPNLLESELFGYVGGAFTGANAKGKPGMFELADTGTLFLDEIGELPLNLQSALLRALQEGEITRVGDTKSKKIDARIITATNRNLEEMIDEGSFRSDLYYRLNVVSVNIPPLRERPDDIPPLAEKTIKELNKKYKTEKNLSPGFVKYLMTKEWLGNIRELKNYIEKQFVLSDSNIIDIPSTTATSTSTQGTSSHTAVSYSNDELPTYAKAKAEMEKELFKKALEKGKSTYTAAALLDMSQPTFYRKYKSLFPNGIE